MDLGIAGRNAVVTGGSQGIGRAIATVLAREGAAVAIVAREPTRLEAAAREIAALTGGRVVAIPADLTRADDITRMADAACAAVGDVDILVNNAGSSPMGRLADLDDATWQASIDLKLMGYIRAARAFLPAMAARRWGRVVNIIGVGGHQSMPHYVAGAAINAALLSLTRALAKDYGPSGVTVNGVSPGPIATARLTTLATQRSRISGRTIAEELAQSAANVPLGRPGTPEEVAAVVAFLCSAEAAFVSGALLDVDGAMSRGL